jgi:hypothetical protein
VGYLIRRQPWCEHLWNINPQVAAFDEKAEQRRESLKSLRRSYVIKLFADHANTQSLFASLAKDLEDLIGYLLTIVSHTFPPPLRR